MAVGDRLGEINSWTNCTLTPVPDTRPESSPRLIQRNCISSWHVNEPQNTHRSSGSLRLATTTVINYVTLGDPKASNRRVQQSRVPNWFAFPQGSSAGRGTGQLGANAARKERKSIDKKQGNGAAVAASMLAAEFVEPYPTKSNSDRGALCTSSLFRFASNDAHIHFNECTAQCGTEFRCPLTLCDAFALGCDVQPSIRSLSTASGSFGSLSAGMDDDDRNRSDSDLDPRFWGRIETQQPGMDLGLQEDNVVVLDSCCARGISEPAQVAGEDDNAPIGFKDAEGNADASEGQCVASPRHVFGDGSETDRCAKQKISLRTPLALKIFTMLDRDADGVLSAHELHKFVRFFFDGQHHVIGGADAERGISTLCDRIFQHFSAPSSGLTKPQWLSLIIGGVPGASPTRPLNASGLELFLAAQGAGQPAACGFKAPCPANVDGSATVSAKPECTPMMQRHVSADESIGLDIGAGPFSARVGCLTAIRRVILCR